MRHGCELLENRKSVVVHRRAYGQDLHERFARFIEASLVDVGGGELACKHTEGGTSRGMVPPKDVDPRRNDRLRKRRNGALGVTISMAHFGDGLHIEECREICLPAN